MTINDVDMQDFLDVLYPFLEKNECLEVEMFWTDSEGEEGSEIILREEMVQYVEDKFIDNKKLESFGIKAIKLLVNFVFQRDQLEIEYPGGFENEMTVFRALNEDDDFVEELKDAVDEEEEESRASKGKKGSKGAKKKKK